MRRISLQSYMLLEGYYPIWFRGIAGGIGTRGTSETGISGKFTLEGKYRKSSVKNLSQPVLLSQSTVCKWRKNAMMLKCPHCGKKVAVNGLGRKPLNILLKNVLESLWAYRGVTAAAQGLGCNLSDVFFVLKAK
jgi:hypothetical protein